MTTSWTGIEPLLLRRGDTRTRTQTIKANVRIACKCDVLAYTPAIGHETRSLPAVTSRAGRGAMGHQHLLGIPRSKAWRAVVALIADGVGCRDHRGSRFEGGRSQHDRRGAMTTSCDRAFSCSCKPRRPLSKPNSRIRPEKIGLQVSDEPDAHRNRRRHVGSDRRLCIAPESAGPTMANSRNSRLSRACRWLLAVKCRICSVRGRIAFTANCAGLAEPKNFAVLARDFFARLTRRHLNFYLSRVLAAHVGSDRRFPKLVDQEDFEVAMDLHCREASRIIKEFARDWYSKAHLPRAISTGTWPAASCNIAAGKIRDELRERRQAHA